MKDTEQKTTTRRKRKPKVTKDVDTFDKESVGNTSAVEDKVEQPSEGSSTSTASENKTLEEKQEEVKQPKITKLSVQEEPEENHEKKKVSFFNWFHKKDEEEDEEEDLTAKKPEKIKSPSGKSMISEFEDNVTSIDSAVLKKLKKGDVIGRLAHHKSTKKSSTINSLIKKVNECKHFNPSVDQGLNDEQVHQRIQEGLMNRTAGSYSRSYWEIIKNNVFTFFNVVLTAIGIALLTFKRYSDCTFLLIMLVNIAIGIFQEIKSKKTIDKLKLVTAPSAKVIRNGKQITVPTSELVIDDIVVLATGNQISADSVVMDGLIEVNESLLTGESLPVKKEKGSTIYAGSFVVSGSAKVMVTKVAESNWALGIQAKAKQFTSNKSELLKSLNSIIKVISLIIIPIAACIFTVNWLNAPKLNNDFYAIGQFAVSKTAGPIVGMVPAGMYLLTSVALAVGVIRLSKRKTLVQDLYCFEMLARTNVLCLDKTGTLTDGTMEVNEVVYLNKNTDLNTIMGSFLNSFSESNQTTIALAQQFPLNAKLTPIQVLPFSSSRKLSAVSFKDNGTYILGAPEYIYKANDSGLVKAIEERQRQGYRVVMFAHSDGYLDKDNNLNAPVVPIALFVLIDHIRKEAPDTIKWFQENGVDVKIISGDNPFTASEIAGTCGVKNADKCISLEGLSVSEVQTIADKYTVFGRVSPEQKATLVKALRNKGKTVSMTGDGVNDILAMKQADCSIAMASGAEAPKNVAQLVLLDSNFASMPAVVMEGRRVINNIQRSSALFLMKTIFTGVLVLTFIILGFSTVSSSTTNITYPFTSGNLMLMEFCGIGVPSFFLALQPNKNQIKGHFLRNTFSKAIPGAICLLLFVATSFTLAQTGIFDLNGETFSYNSPSTIVLCILGMTFVSLGVLYCLCRPLNTYRTFLIVGDIAILLILVFGSAALNLPIFGKSADDLVLFSIYDFNKIYSLTAILFAFASPVITSIVFAFFSPETFRKDKGDQTDKRQ